MKCGAKKMRVAIWAQRQHPLFLVTIELTHRILCHYVEIDMKRFFHSYKKVTCIGLLVLSTIFPPS